MNDEISLAANCCQTNNVANLKSLVPSHVNPNELIPKIKLNVFSRNNVPLICVAAASGSLDCVKYLVSVGANIDAADVTISSYFL